MAEVYLVNDTLEDRRLALKQLKAGETNRDYFMHEFRVLARLDHPNLVQVYDFGSSDDTCYYTCEFLAGQDLYHATQVMDYDDLHDVVRQVLDALAFIHDRGLVHYDVKPENINVAVEPASLPGGRPTHRVKLVDFGLTGEATTSRGAKVKGTVHYVAPEVAKSLPADRRADLYSLGITLYYVISRKLPYEGDSAIAILRKHIEETPEPLAQLRPDVPEAWAEFVQRLIEKDPALRYPTAPAALADLSRRLGKPHESGVVRRSTASTGEDTALAPSFVGRQHEFDRLVAELPRPDQPALVNVFLVEGEEGSGKTRLVHELKVQAQLTGVPCFLVSCAEDGDPPFERVIRLVLTLRGVRDLALERRAELELLFPGVLGGEQEREESADEEALRRAHDRAAELLLRAAEVHPYVLVLENLQQGDETSQALVGALLRSLAYSQRRSDDLPLLVLTARPGAPPRGLGEVIEILRGRGSLETIELESLSAEDTAIMIASMLALPAPHPELGARIHRATRGNPLFVGEVVRSLVAEGLLSLRQTELSSEELERVQPPGSLAELLGRQLVRLHVDNRKVLTALAVLDAPVPLELLSQVANLFAEPTLEALDQLLRRQMVVRLGGEAGDPPRYRLTHSSVQRAVLKGSPRAAQEETHRQALEGLLASHPVGLGRDEVVERLARHAYRGGDMPQALEFSVAAGLRAQLSGNANHAIELFDRALELIRYEQVPADEALRHAQEGLVLTRLSEVLSTVGRYADASRVLEELLALGGDVLEPQASIWVRRRLGDLALKQGNAAEARRWLQEALNAAVGGGERRAERARVLEVMSRIMLWRGDYLQVISLASEAAETFRSLGRARDSIWALNLACAAECYRGQTHRAAEILGEILHLLDQDSSGLVRLLDRHGFDDELQSSLSAELRRYDASLPLRREGGDAFGLILTFSELGTYFDLRAGRDTAAQFYERSQEVYERLGDAQRTALSCNNLGVYRRHQGELAQALELFERSLAIHEGTSDRTGGAVTLMNLALTHLFLGDIPGALGRARRALDVGRELGITWLTGHCHRVIGRLLASQREHLDADRELQRAAGVFRMLGNTRSLADLLMDRAEVAAELGDAEAAQDYLARAKSTQDDKPADFRCRQRLLEGLLLMAREPSRAADELEAALRQAELSEIAELRLAARRTLASVYARLDSVRMAQEHQEQAQTLEDRLLANLPAELRETFLRTPLKMRARETERFVSERLLDELD